MRETALLFLYRVAVRLPDNQYAKAIYNLSRMTDRLDTLKVQKLLEIGLEENVELEKPALSIIDKNRDYRFRHLYLKDFRKFPHPQPNETDFYGVSFCREGKDASDVMIPESTLIQADNGIGKTSVFGSMEYLFTGRMSDAEKHGLVSVDELKDFLPYAGATRESVQVNVDTQSTLFSLKTDTQGFKDSTLCLLPFFCSEYDIDKIVRYGLNEFVYEQMGYGLIRKIILQIRDELETIEKENSAREETYDVIQGKVNEMDRELGVYKKLSPFFMELLLKKNNGQSFEAVSNPVSRADSSSIQSLSKEDLESELSEIRNFVGQSVAVRMVEKSYSSVLDLLKEGEGQPDSLLDPISTNKDDLTHAQEELSCFRNCLSVVIDKIIGSDGTQDESDLIEWYVVLLKDKKRELEEFRLRVSSMESEERLLRQKNVFVEFLETLESEVYSTVDRLTKCSRELMNEVMHLFLMDGEKMELVYDASNGEFNMDIIFQSESGREVAFTPEHYLNTFRYKLYCMTLKVSMALVVRQFYKINFPIVLDDIFYSSDFVHRSSVKYFFRMLFQKSAELFPQDELQVILLSHDEVVIEAAFRGIRDVTANVSWQLMFDYRDVEDSDKVEVMHDSDDGRQKASIYNLICHV